MEIPKYLVIDIWLKFKHMPRGTSLKLLFLNLLFLSGKKFTSNKINQSLILPNQ